MGLFRKKQTVDPVDFLVLQNEIAHLKERLEAAEQAKVILEDQLGALAATTMVLSNSNRTDATDIVEQLEAIQQRLDASDAVGTKVDALHRRVIDVENRQATAVDAEQIAQLGLFKAANEQAQQMDQELLTQLAERVEQVAQLAMAPAQPDDVLAARLLDLERTATSVEALNRQVAVLTTTVTAHSGVVEQFESSARQADELASQVAELSERATAHAEMSGQLSELTARISELQAQGAQADELRARLEQVAAASAANGDHARHEAQLAALDELSQRMATTEAEATRAREHAAQLEQRLSHIGTELTNQLGELSRELDSLAARPVEGGAAAGGEMLESLRAGQVKLAAEQARHEITFREDLAAIAEQLRHLRQAGAL
jgi:myosin heavy subunit